MFCVSSSLQIVQAAAPLKKDGKSMTRLCLTLTAALVLCTAVTNADTFNKKTKLSFSQPIRVPGTTLSPGSYIFKLVDSQSSRHIVQVMNTRENKVYATVLAIPDYRLNPHSQTVVTFGEVGAGCAPAVKAWFYPGDNSGNRFVYGKAEAEQMARSCNQPVPHVPTEVASAAVTAPEVKTSNSTEPAVVALVQAPIRTATPDAKETTYAAANFEQADREDRGGVSGEVPTAPPTEKLPKSASDIPLYTALGGLLLVTGWLNRRVFRT
jgi:hypothetical protein